MAVESLFNSLPTHWEVTTLGKVCERTGGDIQTGPFGSQLHASDYVPFGIPSIMPKNIGDNRVVTEGIARITSQDAKRLSRYLVRTGDIVYSRRGDVERRALIRAEEDGWLCGTGCLRVRFGNGEIDPLYASYYLGHPNVREWIVRHAIGATMPNLNTSILSALPFVVPPPSEQKAIARILSSLDDKIELNQQMNGTLEAIARAIFKSWFVDFDPVRAKMEGRQPEGMDAATADLFPDEFEDSPLGKIPKGWTIEQIRLRATAIQYGLTQSSSSNPVGPNFLRITDIQGGVVDWSKVPFCQASPEEHQRYRVQEGDIFVARTGASTGENIYIVDAPDAVFASYLVRFQFAEPYTARVVGAFMRTASYFDYVAGAIGGSAQPNASAQVLAGATLVFSSPNIAQRFYQTVRPLDMTIAANQRQSRTLSSIRDTLLPKLLSGEIRVKDAEKLM